MSFPSTLKQYNCTLPLFIFTTYVELCDSINEYTSLQTRIIAVAISHFEVFGNDNMLLILVVDGKNR